MIDPAGIEPAGVEPSWPEMATPKTVFDDVLTGPARLPPFSVIAAPQFAYGVPSSLRGVGRLSSGAFPSIRAANGTLRQSVVKNGTSFSGSALRRSQGVFRSGPPRTS